MINKKSRLLVLEYPFVLALKKRKIDRYSLVGGTIEKKETPEETLIRETHEEVGIKISINDLKFVETISYCKKGTTFERYYYTLKSLKWNFKVKEPEKFDAVEWIDFYENKSKLKKSDRKVIQKIFKKEL